MSGLSPERVKYYEEMFRPPEVPPPSIPTESDDPALYTRWLYGLEELSANLGIPEEQIQKSVIISTKRGGYTSAFAVLDISRKMTRIMPDRVAEYMIESGREE